MRWLIALFVPPLLVIVLGAGFTARPPAGVDVNPGVLPALAQTMLPMVRAELADTCPELPVVWLVAQVQAESGWDPHAYSTAGAAGLLQMLPGSWVEAGGGAGWSARPEPSHPVWNADTHLRVAVPWMCLHLRMVTEHLRDTGKPTPPLYALAVCHIAGCSRVTGSTTGIPTAGEAGCAQSCVDQINAYLAAIDRYVQQYAMPLTLPPGTGAAAAPYPGGPPGCLLADPTGTGGCLTYATAWMLAQTLTSFPAVPVSCWDAHAWNPGSDHPKGRACDFTIGAIGRFPPPEQITQGWQMAEWLRLNAAPLQISYIIWQGRIWTASRADQGWRVYGGGGVYDPTSPTGGHYDHIHVSVAI